MAEPDRQNSPMQKRWLVLAGIVVLALIFLIPFIQEGGARVDTNVVVETEPAVLGDIQETTRGKARVIGAQSISQEAEYTGTIDTVLVEEGTLVQPGDQLAVYGTEDLTRQTQDLLDEMDALDDEIAQTDMSGTVDVTAPVSGLVKEIYGVRGQVAADVMEEHKGLLALSADGLLQAELVVDGETPLEEGEDLSVQLGDQTQQGTIAEIELRDGDQMVQVTFPDQPDWLLGQEVQFLDGEGTVLGSGTVQAHQLCLVEGSEGIISHVEVEVGDEVSEGDVLLSCIEEDYNDTYLKLLDQRLELVNQLFRLQEFLKNPVLTAEGTGIVTDLSVEEGEPVEAGQRVCSLVSDDTFQVQTYVLEAERERIQVGKPVRFVQDGTTYQGWVTRTGSESLPVGGLSVCPVTVLLEQASGLETDTWGEVTLILDQAEDAILVPAEAVQTQSDGSQVVAISYGDGLTKLCQVETGLSDGTWVQILSGVQEGDQVVVASHVVETTIFSLFHFEWIIGQEEEPVETDLLALPDQTQTAE